MRAAHKQDLKDCLINLNVNGKVEQYSGLGANEGCTCCSVTPVRLSVCAASITHIHNITQIFMNT